MTRRSTHSRSRDELGYVAIMIAILLPTVFLGLAAIGVDTARWYLEAEKVQLAADAAALSGVPFLPQDFASAETRALFVAKRNGYDDADPDVEVNVELGARNSQLKVTIVTNITNQFGRMIGVDEATIGRTATADYTGPAPMGSPCNAFGTEPPSGTGDTAATGGAKPVGSAVGSSRPTNCPQDPELWATVEGPETGKVQGDRYGTRRCEDSGVDGCDGSRNNNEYNQAGYFWLVKVMPGMVGKPISLQVYDPAFVLTGQFCDSNTSSSSDQLPSYNDLRNDMNPFAWTDGKTRYANIDTIPSDKKPAIPFCPGDSFAGAGSGSSTKHKMTTSFLVREQTDTQDPLKASVQTGNDGLPCAKQFGSYNSYPTVNSLRSDRSDYKEQLAKVFHNWVEICSFTPTREGDYYLHVRTNKRYDFSGNTLVRDVPSGSLAGVASADGDSSPYGEGTNSFAIRAVTPAGQERNVAVSGWDRMPIYANSEAASTEFNLIRILPGAAGQTIDFQFFDAGDAAGTATVSVKLPDDARTPAGAAIATKFPGGCKSWGGSAGGTETSPGQTSNTCTFTLTRQNNVSRNNGKAQTIRIPIPTDYSCTADVYRNCWYKVAITFASGDVHDVTTWDAEIVGDPVRLIE